MTHNQVNSYCTRVAYSIFKNANLELYDDEFQCCNESNLRHEFQRQKGNDVGIILFESCKDHQVDLNTLAIAFKDEE